MAQSADKTSATAREAALARRRALSSAGKAALKQGAAAPTSSSSSNTPARAASTPTAARTASKPAGVGRAASLARREALSTRGKAALGTTERVRTAPPKARQGAPAPEKTGCGCGCKGENRERSDAPRTESTPSARPQSERSAVSTRANARATATKATGRALALARRQALSTRGKAGVSDRGMTPAQTARAANPNLSGRELSQALRAQRSQMGNAGQKKSPPTGRIRPGKTTAAGPAQDAPWKVGASETAHGQTVTGTIVGRSTKVTGDEPSTCRTVTGTEYLGADIFRAFCQTEPSASPRKVSLSPTTRGNRVTGSVVGRSTKVTGDEPGTCKRVTGTEYLSAGQLEGFCATKPEPTPAKVTRVDTRKGNTVTGSNVGRSAKVTGDEPGAGRQLTGTQYMQAGDGQAPAKVGVTKTLRGGAVTGTMTGRSAKVTGDEPGSCRNVTGDEYIGQEQYEGFCPATPAPQDAKVGASKTLRGETVTGTMTGRSDKVTGDEPGTCKAITGTPYAGAEQYRSYCKPDEASVAAARMHRQRASVMTGQQPGIGGKLTGAAKGACEPVTGTPYLGADQFAAACPAVPAEPGSPDFPQPLDTQPWGQFSVTAPAQAAQVEQRQGAVTGTRYEQGTITGPFGKAAGRVTGTEEFRFGRGNGAAGQPGLPVTAPQVEGRVKSRVTGEGMDGGLRITGDDWDRGDRVTGTEGTSAMRRNPTRRGGPISAMPAMQAAKRNEELPEPVSKVTGGSGNTEKGALVTYSGGARG